MKKTINELVLLMQDAVVIGDSAKSITTIFHDSRVKNKNGFFVCITGATVDGHKFIEQAVANGAVAVLVDRDVEVPAEVTVVKVPDVKSAIQVIVPYFYDYPARKLRMIGVTGTNGKTTVTYLLRNILRKAGFRVGVIGTIQIMIENEVLPIHNTTPDVIELQNILARMVESGIDYVVMEVSSHALAQNRVVGCEFDVGIFTNLTQDHLDYHNTLENYAAAKAQLFTLIGQPGEKSGKVAVINADDAYSDFMLAHCTYRALTYGIHKSCDLQAKQIAVKANGAQFAVEGAYELDLRLKITGIFNVYNVMAAIGAACSEGIEPAVIKDALESTVSVPGRFELVDEGQEFAVIVDYAHTPDGLENILNTARQITDKRIITVFGCGGNRDRTKRPLMGGIAARLSDIVIATSDNPRHEEPGFILEEIEVGILPEINAKLYEKIIDRKSAIHRAVSLARAGDVVIIAGKGHEDYQILGDKTIHFDDKEVAREALRGI